MNNQIITRVSNFGNVVDFEVQYPPTPEEQAEARIDAVITSIMFYIPIRHLEEDWALIKMELKRLRRLQRDLS